METIRASRPDWHGHLLLIHHTEQERRAGVATWVRCGLELGEKVLYIEPPGEPVERSLADVLAEQQVVVDGAAARGQLQILPAHEDIYSADGLADAVDHALAQGYRGVRLSAEARPQRVLSGRAHEDLEWATDLLCRTRPVSVLCQYSADLARKALPEVLAMHGDGVRETLLHTARLPGGIIVRGEVDVSNHDVLHWRRAGGHARRRGLVRGGPEPAGVPRRQRSEGVAGRPRRSYRHGGGRVRLRGPQHLVNRVLELCRVDQAGGLRVDHS